jgi:hypothetical protein
MPFIPAAASCVVLRLKSIQVQSRQTTGQRALRPYVVLRKFLGTLRKDKGTSIRERTITTLATWGQKGPNSPTNANRKAGMLNIYD